MPTYDGECPKCATLYQFFVKHWQDENPTCTRCGQVVKRLISAPAVVDAHTENFPAHYQYRKNDDGTNTRVLIDSRSAQKAFCRHQKLHDPKELPSDLPQRIDEYGKLKSARGNGEWI